MRPKYRQIADEIAEKIKNGTYTPGDRIPSESELVRVYSASQTTVRRAVVELSREGQIIVRHGSGAFVREHRPRVRRVPTRYARDRGAWLHEAEAAGQGVEQDHATDRTAATPAIAWRLGVDTGAGVVRTRYRTRMDGDVVSTSVCWEPADLVAGTEVEDPHTGPMADAGIRARMAHIGITVDALTEDIVRVLRAGAEEAATLEVAIGDPLYLIEQSFMAGDRVVMASEVTMVADRYRLSYRVEL